MSRHDKLFQHLGTHTYNLGAVIEKWATKKVGKVLFCTLCDKDV